MIGRIPPGMPIRIIGSFVSPYVRKVLAAMNLKGLAYEVDPITPFYGNDEFERLSPLRRIPVLIDGDFTISDSSVICAYLDDAYPGHPLFPADPKRASPRPLARGVRRHPARRPLHLGLFYQKVVRPLVWGEPTDEEARPQDAGGGYPGGPRLSRARAARLRLPLRRDRASRTSPSRASSATAPMRASKWTASAGRGRRRSSQRTLAHPASPACCRSRTFSAAPPSRVGARPCSTRALR